MASCFTMWIWLRWVTSSQNLWPGGDLASWELQEHGTSAIPSHHAIKSTTRREQPCLFHSYRLARATTERRGEQMGVGARSLRLGVALGHSTPISFGWNCYGITGSVENAPSRNSADQSVSPPLEQTDFYLTLLRHTALSYASNPLPSYTPKKYSFPLYKGQGLVSLHKTYKKKSYSLCSSLFGVVLQIKEGWQDACWRQKVSLSHQGCWTDKQAKGCSAPSVPSQPGSPGSTAGLQSLSLSKKLLACVCPFWDVKTGAGETTKYKYAVQIPLNHTVVPQREKGRWPIQKEIWAWDWNTEVSTTRYKFFPIWYWRVTQETRKAFTEPCRRLIEE